MKFKFKGIISALALVCAFFVVLGVIAMDSNFKKVPSQPDTSVSIDSNDSNADSDDTSDITVENLADTILQVKSEFDANNIKFNKITVQLSGDKSGIYWMYIPYEIINESDILQLTTENSTYVQYYD